MRTWARIEVAYGVVAWLVASVASAVSAVSTASAMSAASTASAMNAASAASTRSVTSAQEAPVSVEIASGGRVRALDVLDPAVRAQMPARNGIPSKDDPPLATDDGPMGAIHLAEDVAARLVVPELSDERREDDTGDPVALHNGMASLRVVDLRLAGRGFDLELARRYDSHRGHVPGTLGYGWQHSFDVRLHVTPNGAELVNGNGRVDAYTFVDATTLAAPPGVYARIVWDGVGANWVLRNRRGTRTWFAQVPGDDPATWRAVRIADRHENAVTFHYASGGRLERVVDTLGRELEFFHDALGRLVRVRDAADREVRYTYDSAGDLVAVRSPVIVSTGGFADAPSGHVERYAYHASPAGLAHRLERVVGATQVADGSLTPRVRFEYVLDPASPFFGWARVQHGGTASIGYAYALENTSVPSGTPGVVRVVTTVTDRAGGVTQYRFDESGHARSIRERRDDGSWATTAFEYDADGEVTRTVRPEGDEELRAYQGGSSPFARGNLVRVERRRGPRAAAQDALVTTLGWEPVYQHPSTFVDERGATTRWLADWMEGGAGPASGHDVLDAIASELGVSLAEAAALAAPHLVGVDLNGDGRRALVRGDLLQRVEPTASTTSLAGAPQATACGDASPAAIRSATYDRYGRVTSETDPEENVSVFLYTPASDLDGDGVVDPDAPAGADATTGGWLTRVVEDTTLPFADPQLAGVAPRALGTDRGRNRGFRPPASPVERVTDLVHDRAGRLLARVDGRGVRTDYSVDERDRVWRVVRGSDVSAAAQRHGGCDPTSAEDLLGSATPVETRFLADPDGRLAARFDLRFGDSVDGGAWPGWLETWYARDVAGLVTAVAQECGANGEMAVTTFVRDGNGDVELVISPEGRTERFERDARGDLRARTVAHGTPQAATETWRRDANRNVIEHVDLVGHVTTFTLDGFDRVVSLQRPDGSRRDVEWDAGSNPLSVVDAGTPDGVAPTSVALRRVEYVHDARSRLVRIDQLDPRQALADGALSPGDGRVTTILEHDRANRVTFRIDDAGALEATAYDGLSRPVATRDALGNQVETCFDDESNEARVVRVLALPNGSTRTEVTSTTFDALGRAVTEVDAAGGVRRWRHGSGSAPVEEVDALGNRSRFVHDVRERLVRVERELRVGGSGAGALDVSHPLVPGGVVDVEFVYDRDGRRIAARDDGGRSTRFEYDARGHQSAVVRPSGLRFEMRRDARGDLVSVTDARGNQLDLLRDALGRPVAIDRVVSAPLTHGSAALRFRYDGLGRRVRSVDSVDDVLGNADDVVVERAFDALGRLVRDDQGGRVVSATWRGEELRTGLVYPSGLALTFEYDALHRAVLVRQGPFELVRDTYAGPRARDGGAGQRLQRVLANGAAEIAVDASGHDTGYVDSAGRPTRLDHRRGASWLATFQADYDANGRRTSSRRAHDGGRGDNAEYDSLGRLVRLEHGVPAADVGTLDLGREQRLETWTLDGGHGAGVVERHGVAFTARRGLDGELVSFGGEEPVHDADGNLVVLDARAATPIALEYDAFDRLRAVTRGASRIEHDYDAEGRRVRTRTFGIAGAPAAVSYVYDGWNEVEQRAGDGTVLVRTVHGGLDEPARVEVNGLGVFSLLRGIGGDVVAVADASGAIVERVDYDAYGMPRFLSPAGVDTGRATSAYGNPFLFAGRRFEPWIVPLVDLRARFLSPRHGVFLQRDPLGEWADLANLGNAYAYVAADPWNRRDPFGLEGWTPAWLHEGLSWAGFVPGVGVGADLIDATLYLVDGEWGEAAMAGVAAIPVLGDGYAAGRKVGKGLAIVGGVAGGIDDLKKTKDLKKAGKDVIDELKKIGDHPHGLKDGGGGSRADIFVDRDGELYRGLKDGSGFAERLWINLKDLFQ